MSQTGDGTASLRARDRRARRALSESVKSLAGRRVIVHVHQLLDAMFDARIGHGVHELMALSAASAMGSTQDQRQCFVCCRPWGPTVTPLGSHSHADHGHGERFAAVSSAPSASAAARTRLCSQRCSATWDANQGPCSSFTSRQPPGLEANRQQTSLSGDQPTTLEP